jgi:hypothetical protein
MSMFPTFASTVAAPRRIKFVLVNDRVPREDTRCALCGRGIGKGYVRELQTRLLYCDTQCAAGHTKMAKLAVENATRKVS